VFSMRALHSNHRREQLNSLFQLWLLELVLGIRAE
jgi:hypothetical protein